MSILVTGGCGYIGSHVVRQLSERGESPIVLDNLSTGSREALVHDEKLFVCDLADIGEIDKILQQNQIDSVIHFAASIVVPESVRYPAKYYLNNSKNTLQLIDLCTKNKVQNFIFSSTAAVYGYPPNGIAAEDSPTKPINPYGNSKLVSEIMLKDIANANDMKYVVLRYFNVAGADPQSRIGQRGKEATHLIKICCQAITGQRDKVQIFGADYNTPDGTCIRDYIHIEDLASAHLKALEYLRQGGESSTFNLGYGTGSSVREVIDTVKKVSGIDFQVVESPRREGDPAVLIAKVERARTVLNWQPEYANLELIVRDAYNWEKKLSKKLALEVV